MGTPQMVQMMRMGMPHMVMMPYFGMPIFNPYMMGGRGFPGMPKAEKYTWTSSGVSRMRKYDKRWYAYLQAGMEVDLAESFRHLGPLEYCLEKGYIKVLTQQAPGAFGAGS